MGRIYLRTLVKSNERKNVTIQMQDGVKVHKFKRKGHTYLLYRMRVSKNFEKLWSNLKVNSSKLD